MKSLTLLVAGLTFAASGVAIAAGTPHQQPLPPAQTQSRPHQEPLPPADTQGRPHQKPLPPADTQGRPHEETLPPADTQAAKPGDATVTQASAPPKPLHARQ